MSEAAVPLQEDVYSGFVRVEGKRIQVDFSAPPGASQLELDAAFFGARTTATDVDYLKIGTRPLRAQRDQDESNALNEHINSALLRGDSPITRMAGTKHFTLDYQGAEVLFTHFMLVQFESYLREPLLVHAEGPNEVILPGSSVRARVEQDAWVTAVAAKETKESFYNWRE